MKLKIYSVLIAGLFLGACSEDQKVEKQVASQSDVVVSEENIALPETVETTNPVETSTSEAVDKTIETEVAAPEAVEEAPPEQSETAETSTSSAPTAHQVAPGARMSFEPLVVFAQPGDTVTWSNMLGHDTSGMADLIPEGAEPWQSQMGETFTITVEKEGVYLYKCTPHVALGMMAAIVVGEPTNLDAIKEAAKTTKENKGFVRRTLKKLDKALAAK